MKLYSIFLIAENVNFCYSSGLPKQFTRDMKVRTKEHITDRSQDKKVCTAKNLANCSLVKLITLIKINDECY